MKKPKIVNPVSRLIERARAGHGIVLPPHEAAYIGTTILQMRAQIEALEGVTAEYQRMLQETDDSEE